MKKYALLLLIPFLLIGLTGCGKTNNKEVDKGKTLVLEDTKLGLKTTFTYEEKLSIGDIEYSEEGKSKSVEFDIESLDAEFEMYYTNMTDIAYKDNKNTRSAQKYYKEYTFGDYKAYAYSESGSSIKMNILLKENDNKMYDVLFVSMERLDSDDTIIMKEVLDSEELQEFFKSIKFKKSNSKQQ